MTYKVSKNYVAGTYIYQVYRTIDPEETDHSGNREVIGTFGTKEEAEALAEEMNA